MSGEPDEVEQALRANVLGPRRAQGDEGSVEQHSPIDQIAVDRYLAARDAARRPHRAVRLVKIVPPGSV